MGDFFTANELAKYFGVNPKIIYRLAERAEIPGQRINDDWRFSGEEVSRALYRGPSLEKLQQMKEEAEEKSKRTIQKMKLLQLRERFHQSVIRSLKKNLKGHKWESIVGYNLDTLKQRLKKTIPEAYSWQDFIDGNLQLDHIIPGSAFNIEGKDCLDLKRCWALSNLQLLPAKENIRKGNKLFKPFQPSLALRG